MAKNAPMMQEQDPAGFHFDLYRSENIRKTSLPINFLIPGIYRQSFNFQSNVLKCNSLRPFYPNFFQVLFSSNEKNTHKLTGRTTTAVVVVLLLSIRWMFPKIVVPPNHPSNRVFHYKPFILGYPYFWKHPDCWMRHLGYPKKLGFIRGNMGNLMS